MHQITCETRLQDNPLLENAAEKYEAKKAERRANKRRRLLDGSGLDVIPAEIIIDLDKSDVEHSFDELVSFPLYMYFNNHILTMHSPRFLIRVRTKIQKLPRRQAVKLQQPFPSRNLPLYQIIYL
jgi:short subunit dehydrogenase-like uncharacterized protein